MRRIQKLDNKDRNGRQKGQRRYGEMGQRGHGQKKQGFF